jgi:uncharacterized RDD family membrane protein YckC
MTPTQVSAVNPNVPAPFGRRVGAYFLDGGLNLLLMGVVYLLFFLLTLLLNAVAEATGFYWLYSLSALLGVPLIVVVVLGYSGLVWYLTATRGYSPAKRILGLRVVDEVTGLPIGYGRAAVRVLVLGLAGSCCGIIAVVMAILTAQHPRRQGWHDLAAHSVVVPLDPTSVPVAQPAAPMQSWSPATPPSAFPAAFPSASPVAPPLPTPPASPPAPMPSPPSPVAPIPDFPSSTHALIPPPPGAASPVGAGPTHDHTVARGQAWTLAAPDGSTHRLEGEVVVGRNPAPSGEFASANVWRIEDPQLSMSKSHAVFGVDASGPWVQDLGSTNGVAVRRTESELPASVGERVSLVVGDVVLLGDVPVSLRGV